MTQTDKIIKAVIMVAVLVCMGLVTNEHWPKVTECNSKISHHERRIEESREDLQKYSRPGKKTKDIFREGIERRQREIDKLTQARSKHLAFLIFGNLGILVIAIGLNCYLIGKKKV